MLQATGAYAAAVGDECHLQGRLFEGSLPRARPLPLHKPGACAVAGGGPVASNAAVAVVFVSGLVTQGVDRRADAVHWRLLGWLFGILACSWCRWRRRHRHTKASPCRLPSTCFASHHCRHERLIDGGNVLLVQAGVTPAASCRCKPQAVVPTVTCCGGSVPKCWRRQKALRATCHCHCHCYTQQV